MALIYGSGSPSRVSTRRQSRYSSLNSVGIMMRQPLATDNSAFITSLDSRPLPSLKGRTSATIHMASNARAIPAGTVAWEGFGRGVMGLPSNTKPRASLTSNCVPSMKLLKYDSNNAKWVRLFSVLVTSGDCSSGAVRSWAASFSNRAKR